MMSIVLSLALALSGQDSISPKPVTVEELEKAISSGLGDQAIQLEQCLSLAMENQPRIQSAMASLR
ncbi:MAG: hypothetical protein ACKO26_16555, partial [Planctomycetota bacterium]